MHVRNRFWLCLSVIMLSYSPDPNALSGPLLSSKIFGMFLRPSDRMIFVGTCNETLVIWYWQGKARACADSSTDTRDSLFPSDLPFTFLRCLFCDFLVTRWKPLSTANQQRKNCLGLEEANWTRLHGCDLLSFSTLYLTPMPASGLSDVTLGLNTSKLVP